MLIYCNCFCLKWFEFEILDPRPYCASFRINNKTKRDTWFENDMDQNMFLTLVKVLNNITRGGI